MTEPRYKPGDLVPPGADELVESLRFLIESEPVTFGSSESHCHCLGDSQIVIYMIRCGEPGFKAPVFAKAMDTVVKFLLASSGGTVSRKAGELNGDETVTNLMNQAVEAALKKRGPSPN